MRVSRRAQRRPAIRPYEVLGVPGPVRCGCIAILALLLVLLVAAAAVVWLATRGIGPRYDAGVYTVDTAQGGTRIDRIGSAAALRFDAKRDPTIASPQDALRITQEGVTFSEEEVNSKLDELLRQNPVAGGGATVERIFLELHPQGTTAYVYVNGLRSRIVLSSRVSFTVERSTVRVHLSSPQVGKLPIGAVLPLLLDWSGKRQQLEERLALALPPLVTAVQPQEGALHVALLHLPLPGGGSDPPPPAHPAAHAVSYSEADGMGIGSSSAWAASSAALASAVSSSAASSAFPASAAGSRPGPA